MNRALRTAARIRAELRKATERARADETARAARQAKADAVLRAHNESFRQASQIVAGDAFLSTVHALAPSLIEGDLVPVLRLVASLPHARPASDWEPRAKGTWGRFLSLLEHLFATVPVPTIVWRGFFDPDADKLAPLVVWLASGGSFFEYAKTRLSIPLTRKTCHVALTLRSERSLLRAIRKAQVLALGGDAALAHAWASSVHASQIHARDLETFFGSFLEWIVTRPHETGDVAIMLDYASQRFAEQNTFSMKGRTVESFLRDARAWHVELARLREVRQAFFRPSGLRSITIARTEPKKVVWRVEEILNAKDLFEEGRRMGHCVYSYGGAVASGSTSIWVMTMEDGEGPTGRWAMLTIEVRNALRAIVQARGRYNRMPTKEEHGILARFAAQNGLSIAL